MCRLTKLVFFFTGGTGIPLTHRYISNADGYGAPSEDNERSSFVDRIYLITERRWHAETVLPVSLLAASEGMSARSHHR